MAPAARPGGVCRAHRHQHWACQAWGGLAGAVTRKPASSQVQERSPGGPGMALQATEPPRVLWLLSSVLAFKCRGPKLFASILCLGLCGSTLGAPQSRLSAFEGSLQSCRGSELWWLPFSNALEDLRTSPTHSSRLLLCFSSHISCFCSAFLLLLLWEEPPSHKQDGKESWCLTPPEAPWGRVLQAPTCSRCLCGHIPCSSAFVPAEMFNSQQVLSYGCGYRPGCRDTCRDALASSLLLGKVPSEDGS